MVNITSADQWFTQPDAQVTGNPIRNEKELCPPEKTEGENQRTDNSNDPFEACLSDIRLLAKTELRLKYKREASSHRNMLSRRGMRGAVIHPLFENFASFLTHVGPIPARGATLDRIDTVFVKEVVRRFHAASLISGAPISFSGLSQTGPAGCQLRVLPDQRSGFCARALA